MKSLQISLAFIMIQKLLTRAKFAVIRNIAGVVTQRVKFNQTIFVRKSFEVFFCLCCFSGMNTSTANVIIDLQLALFFGIGGELVF